MIGARSFALILALVASGLVCVSFEAQAQAPDGVSHVVCIRNESGEALTVWVSELAEVSRPRSGFTSDANRATRCYRRTTTSGVNLGVTLGDFLQPEVTQTAEDRQRVLREMDAVARLPLACEVPASLIERAGRTRERRAVLLLVSASGENDVCVASVASVPAGSYLGSPTP